MSFFIEDLILNSISFQEHPFTHDLMAARADFWFEGVCFVLECEGPKDMVRKKMCEAFRRITGKDMTHQFHQVPTLEMWHGVPKALPEP